ncbi:MAG: glycosyltransferase family 2 protein [Candidatus Omnitrophica bacterium]|nr:glycosyltransferase family 2 protein [Candidatus Omnitrophota bacterium]
MAGLEKKDICVLIPAFNEEKNIGPLMARLRAFGADTLVIDDGSTDRTAEEARRSGAEVLRFERNGGKGASLRRGFDWFLGRSYKAAVMMDADGQHDPDELGIFLAALNEGRGGLIVGNRMGSPGEMPFSRRAVNRLMSLALSVLTRQGIPDSQCGYRAILREALEKINLRADRFETESEILLEASRLGYKIFSVPVRSVYRGGPSNIRPFRDTLRFFRFLAVYSLNRL